MKKKPGKKRIRTGLLANAPHNALLGLSGYRFLVGKSSKPKKRSKK